MFAQFSETDYYKATILRDMGEEGLMLRAEGTDQEAVIPRASIYPPFEDVDNFLWFFLIVAAFLAIC